MSEIFNFFKNIIMGKDSNEMKVGLSQFRTSTTPIFAEKKSSIDSKNVKLSDLMRRA